MCSFLHLDLNSVISELGSFYFDASPSSSISFVYKNQLEMSRSKFIIEYIFFGLLFLATFLNKKESRLSIFQKQIIIQRGEIRNLKFWMDGAIKA